jgi:hypothetical protein
VPRYFIMILPLLLIGWGLHVNWLAEKCKAYGAKEAVAFAGLGLVVLPNLISCANLIREQRGLSRPQDGLKYIGFAQSYHGGKWQGVEEVGKMIQDHVGKDQKVFGPEATVLTYLSDRDVYGLGMFLPRKNRGGAWENEIRKHIRPKFAYGVFPDTHSRLYEDKDVVTGALIKLGMLRPTRTIATGGGYKLCEYEVVTLNQKHSVKTKRNRAAATQPKVRHKHLSIKRHRKPATQSTTAPARKRHRHRAATTRPAPRTTPAATQRSKRGRSAK